VKEPVIYYHIPDSKLDNNHDIAVAAKYAVLLEPTASVAPIAATASAAVPIATETTAVVAKPIRRVMPTVVVEAPAVDVKSDVVAVQPSKKRKAEVETGPMQSQIDARVKSAHLAGVKPQPMTLDEARQLRVEKSASIKAQKKAKTIDLRKAKKAEVKATAQKAAAKPPKVITPAMQSSIDAIVASVKARAALSSSSSYKAVFDVAIVDSLSSAASADEYFDIASDIIAASALDDVVADDDL